MEKTCGKCHKLLPTSDFYKDARAKDGLYTVCKDCHVQYTNPGARKRVLLTQEEKIAKEKAFRRKYNKRRYESYTKGYLKEYKLRPEEMTKYKARAAARAAIKKGVLQKEPCRVCQEVKVDAHHEDYSKPLEIIWLCRADHKPWHAGWIDKETFTYKNNQ